MEIKPLYRTTKNGKTTVSTNKPLDEDYTETYRLIADEGMFLTDGSNKYTCVDTDEPNKFKEVSEAEDEEYAKAGKILLGVDE